MDFLKNFGKGKPKLIPLIPNHRQLDKFLKAKLDSEQPHINLSMDQGGASIGLIFDKGVAIASDNLITSAQVSPIDKAIRVAPIGDNIVIGGTGSYADFSIVQRTVQNLVSEKLFYNDQCKMEPENVHKFLTCKFHSQRTLLRPLLVNLIVGGVQNDGQVYMGQIDNIGTAFTGNVLCIGQSNDLVKGTLEQEMQLYPEISEKLAIKMIHKAMELVYYRSSKISSKFSIGIVNPHGATVLSPISICEDWNLANEGQET